MGKKTLDDYLNEVDYSRLENGYVPTEFALNYINFIKLVNGGEGEENKSPVAHMDLLDAIGEKGDVLGVAHRGYAKSTLCAEYLILYCALYGYLPNHGKVDMGIYIGDTMENGVKSLRKNLQFRYENSDFLKKYIPNANFIENEWSFTNVGGIMTTFRGVGVGSSIRGAKDHGKRPTIIIIDDVLTDKNSGSDTIIDDINKTIYDSARQALHPNIRKMIWIGTPFNKKDPLYVAAGSSSWKTKVYPVCEKFPCTREEFKGSWEDRFDFDFVEREYKILKEAGKLDSFYKELLLRILSDDDRLVADKDIIWYEDRDSIIRNNHKYSWYITTDFATSEKEKADYTVLSI